jgi:hypothetical protein
VLFDLQSPGRRRAIRIIYGLLAAVMFVGFVGFGIGTSGSGPLADLFGNGGGSASSAFDDDIKAQEQALAANPKDTNAMAQLVQLHYSAGNQAVDDNGQLTSDGEQELLEGADAWNRYVKATKGEVAQGPALLALQTFDRLGTTSFQKARGDTTSSEAATDAGAAVDNWKSAAEVQQMLIDRKPKPTPSDSQRLVFYLYLSGQTAEGDQVLAQSGANSQDLEKQLAPYKQLGQQLQSAIKQLQKQQKQQGGGSPGGGGGGSNPLGGIGGSGGLSGGGGLSGAP